MCQAPVQALDILCVCHQKAYYNFKKSQLGARWGQYHAALLHFSHTYFPVPILDWVESVSPFCETHQRPYHGHVNDNRAKCLPLRYRGYSGSIPYTVIKYPVPHRYTSTFPTADFSSCHDVLWILFSHYVITEPCLKRLGGSAKWKCTPWEIWRRI